MSKKSLTSPLQSIRDRFVNIWTWTSYLQAFSLSHIFLLVFFPCFQYALRKLYHESPRVILVLYTSPTCGPCRTLKPILNKVFLHYSKWDSLEEILLDWFTNHLFIPPSYCFRWSMNITMMCILLRLTLRKIKKLLKQLESWELHVCSSSRTRKCSGPEMFFQF